MRLINKASSCINPGAWHIGKNAQAKISIAVVLILLSLSIAVIAENLTNETESNPLPPENASNSTQESEWDNSTVDNPLNDTINDTTNDTENDTVNDTENETEEDSFDEVFELGLKGGPMALGGEEPEFGILGAEDFAGGTGTPGDPYQIDNCTSLRAISSNNLSAHYVLTQPIHCTGVAWYGIGSAANPFNGSFDGGNHMISDLTIWPGGGHWSQGIFKYVEDAEISNVYVNGITVGDNGDRNDDAGGIVGVALGDTTISNCRIVGGMIYGSDDVGGIVGRVGHPETSGSGGVTISDCNFTGIVDGWGHANSGNVGGIAGSAYYGLTITDATVDADVAGGNSIGGIVGKSGDSSYSSGGLIISGCEFSGTVKTALYSPTYSTGGYGGGVVGQGINNVTIQDCDVIADLSGISGPYGGYSMGGIAGSLRDYEVANTHAVVERCSFVGDVNCNNTYCGGIVGQGPGDLIISDCYSRGHVYSVSERCGGLTGFMDSDGVINNSYSSMDVNGTNFVGGLVGKLDESNIYNSFRAIQTYGIVSPGNYVGTVVGYNDYSNLTNVYWSHDGDDTNSNCYRDDSGYSNASCIYAGEGNTYFYTYTHQPIASWSFPPWSTDNAGINTPTLHRSSFSGGSGTPDDPYVVDSPEQIGDINDNPGGHYFFPNGTITVDPGGDPIGSPEAPFTGTITGNGTIIQGVNVTGDGDDPTGFFGVIENGTIRNITLKGNVSGGAGTGGFAGNISGNSTIEGVVINMTVSGGTNTGGFAGGIGGNVSITNVTVGGTVTGGAGTGGFAGNVSGNATVEDVVVTGNVSGGDGTGGFGGNIGGNASVGGVIVTGEVDGGNNTGGFGGTIGGGASINNVSTTGPVTGTGRAGGIAGTINGSAQVGNSSATGDVSGGDTSGGMAGKVEGNARIENSFATGDVSGDDDVGGCLGSMSGSSRVLDIYCMGDVTGDENVGGLLGSMGSSSAVVNRTYATGEVTGNTNTGGLVGHNPPTGTVMFSYYDTNTSGQSDNEGKGVPKTTFFMKYIFTFYNGGWGINEDNYGWDAGAAWGINDALNSGYPFLRWQGLGASRGLFDGGEGNSSDKYQINICEFFNETETFLDKHFTITSDLDCDGKSAVFGQDLVVNTTVNFTDSYVKTADVTFGQGSTFIFEGSILHTNNILITDGGRFTFRNSVKRNYPGTVNFSSAIKKVYAPNVLIIGLSADYATSFVYCTTTDGSECVPTIETRRSITIPPGAGDYRICAKGVNPFYRGQTTDCTGIGEYGFL